MTFPTITLVEVDSGASALDLIAAALTKQFTMEFPRWWNTGGVFRAATTADPLLPTEWPFYLHDKPTATDPTGALAYHYMTPLGLPAGNIFKGLCDQYGDPLSATIGHEGAEALADPYLCRGVFVPATGLWWALEICDAVEGDSYEIDGYPMTNFCTPQWFEPPQTAAGAQYDQMKLCPTAFTIRPNGGYGQTWSKDSGWSQLGSMRPYRAHLARMGLGRGARRG